MDIAKCQKKSKNRFGKFIEEYLFSRKNISLIILLLDIRHNPTENDVIMYDYIRSTNKPYLIIANKADKIAVTKVDNEISKIKEKLKLNDNEMILPFSSDRRIYTENVWNIIDKWSEK